MALYNLAGNASKWWNYGNQNKEGYCPSIAGTVVEVDLVPRTDPATKQIVLGSKSGKPMVNVRYYLAADDGTEYIWEFKPGTFSRPSNARMALTNALLAAGLDTDVDAVLGQRISISTEPGVYNQQNQRPWTIKIEGPGQGQVRGGFDKVQEIVAKMQQRQQPMMQQMPPMDPMAAAVLRAQQAGMTAGYPQQPMMQQQPMQQPQYPQQQQPPMQQPLGYSPYDDDMPF